MTKTASEINWMAESNAKRITVWSETVGQFLPVPASVFASMDPEKAFSVDVCGGIIEVCDFGNELPLAGPFDAR